MNRATKQQTLLLETEAAMRESLREWLPSAVDGNIFLFTNSRFNPHNFPQHHLPETSELLLRQALECLSLREQLALESEGSVGCLYLKACEESACSDEHRRGPKRLATWLLKELQNL